jgi:hypothetical protein
MRRKRTESTPITRALQQYSRLAVRAGCTFELALCHGTVCTLAFALNGAEPGEVLPNDLGLELAAAVAEAQRVRPDWVLTDMAQFIAAASAEHTLQPDEFAPGLTLSINTGARVLAHKLHLLDHPLPAAATDLTDAAFLLRKIHLASPEQVERIYARYYPDQELSQPAGQLIAESIHPLMADTH